MMPKMHKVPQMSFFYEKIYKYNRQFSSGNVPISHTQRSTGEIMPELVQLMGEKPMDEPIVKCESCGFEYDKEIYSRGCPLCKTKKFGIA